MIFASCGDALPAAVPSGRSLVGLITAAQMLRVAGAPLSLGASAARMPEANGPTDMPFAGGWPRSRASVDTGHIW